MFERQMTKVYTERERDFLPLFHSLNHSNSQGWARLLPVARNSLWVSHKGGRGSNTCHHPLSPGSVIRKLDWNHRLTWTETRNCNVDRIDADIPNHRLTHCAIAQALHFHFCILVTFHGLTCSNLHAVLFLVDLGHNIVCDW